MKIIKASIILMLVMTIGYNVSSLINNYSEYQKEQNTILNQKKQLETKNQQLKKELTAIKDLNYQKQVKYYEN